MGGEIMERDIITVYCLIDEYLKVSGIKDDVRAEISNAEVLLIGYMAVNDFSGNPKKILFLWIILVFYWNCESF